MCSAALAVRLLGRAPLHASRPVLWLCRRARRGADGSPQLQLVRRMSKFERNTNSMCGLYCGAVPSISAPPLVS